MNITLPSQIESKDAGENHSVIMISPCYPGYGTTLGNALRRVLLSSLQGAAIIAVKIKGVDHEFTTVEYVKEDVVEIILNLKGIRFLVHSDEPVELELTAKGEKTVTAADFIKNSSVEVVNTDAVIATLTDKKAELNMKVIVQKGRGYVPVEMREKEKLDVGYVSIDAIYTPVRNVNYSTEHVRVGQMTNFDKLLLDISTDGTMAPEEAFKEASKILVEQFQVLSGEIANEEGTEEVKQMELVEDESGSNESMDSEDVKEETEE